MEEKVLLFVDDAQSFVIKSIMQKLRGLKYLCETTRLSVYEMVEYKDRIDGYVFYNHNEKADFDQAAFQFLKEMCLDKGLKLIAMGTQEKLEELYDSRFAQDQWGEFYKPLNAVQIAEDIDMMIKQTVYDKKKHILVVDDSGTMLNTIKAWLEGPYRVSLVNSATNALTFLSRQTPDLILLDYEMPVCSGAQLLEMIRNNEAISDIPVIFLTGHADADSVKEVLSLKPNGYLLKSTPKEQIERTIFEFFKNQASAK